MSSFSFVLLVAMGRSSVNIFTADISPAASRSNSPATNCITTCQALCLILSETNFRNPSVFFMVSTTCLAARNSCTVRCRKQNWASPASMGVGLFRSGRRWSNPQSSTPLTSLAEKVSLPSSSPRRAIFPKLLKTLWTWEGNSQYLVKINWSLPSDWRYSSLCLKKKILRATLYILVSLVGRLQPLECICDKQEQMMKQWTGI